MFRQELDTLSQSKKRQEQRVRLNERINQIHNNQTYNQLPTKEVVDVVNTVSSEFDTLKSQNLTEIRRFLNISTQIAQLNKSKQSLSNVNTKYNQLKSSISSIDQNDSAQQILKKMSNAILLLSDMLMSSTALSRSNTISSVSNSILTRDVAKKFDQLTKKRR